ncbi:MAG: type VI secretion system protein TssA [Rubrivivax sp.]
MANEPIELAPLLAPLEAGEQGVGVDLRLDYTATSPYQRLRDARGAARAEERARDAEDGSEGPPADGWRDVLAVGQQALATQSKDLEIAAWMTEALVRMHGLPGLTVGARLIAGLCDAYWDAGFPRPDEDGLEVRASPIDGLSGSTADGTIMQPLRRLPMFRRADGTGMSVYLWEQAEHAAGLPEDKREARYAAGTPELPTLEAEARLDKAYLTGTWRDATAALQAWRELGSTVDTRFGSDAPSLRKVTNLLEQLLGVATRLGGEPTADLAEEAAITGGAGAAVASGGGGLGEVRTRDDALRELDRIADYFRRTEPHSPLAYTLEEAVRRGRMSLAELLMEVLPDAETRKGMLARLGMRPGE